MRYLGEIHGHGSLFWDGDKAWSVKYEIEGYSHHRGVTTSGELSAPSSVLDSVRGRKDVRLALDDGRSFDILVSPKAIASGQQHIEFALPTGGEIFK